METVAGPMTLAAFTPIVWNAWAGLPVCQAGRVEMAAAEAPAGLWDGEGFRQQIDVEVGGAAAVAHDAVTIRTPLARMLARDIGGPGGARMVQVTLAFSLA